MEQEKGKMVNIYFVYKIFNQNLGASQPPDLHNVFLVHFNQLFKGLEKDRPALREI